MKPKQHAGVPAERVMVATNRQDRTQALWVHDELPPLQAQEIRLSVDKVGLSANNMFYAQMGEMPLLKFFSVYPIPERPQLVNVPAWGTATVVETANPEFPEGEQFRGFLHMTNLVQMKARRTADGFIAYGGGRSKLNPAYNAFKRVEPGSPFFGAGPATDLATVAAPGAVSAFLLCEHLRSKGFYAGDAVVLTCASSKLAMATAFLLASERARGTLQSLVAYTSAQNADFVRSTGLFDLVLTYDAELPATAAKRPVLVDVAGDARVYRRLRSQLVKALAVGATHADASASTFAAFRPLGVLKMAAAMLGSKALVRFFEGRLDPKLEMFFAPAVLGTLSERWGTDELAARSDHTLAAFVQAALSNGWLRVSRSEHPDAVRAAYRRIAKGGVPPQEACVVSLSAPDKQSERNARRTGARAEGTRP